MRSPCLQTRRFAASRQWRMAAIAALAAVAGCSTRSASVQGRPHDAGLDEAMQAPSEGDGADAGDAGDPPFDGIPGRLIELGTPRPRVAAEPPACAPRLPLCVHRGFSFSKGSPATPRLALATLAAAERAWRTLTGALAFLPPDPSPSTRAYDVYLAPVDDDAFPVATYLDERDVRSAMDRASAFSVIDPRLGVGCALDFAVARTIARAALYRVAPATDEGSALAETAYLARLMAPCALGMDDGDTEFQRRPFATPVDMHPELAPAVGASIARGARRLPAWLDATYGVEPGSIVRALWALAPTQTKLGAARWESEPDGFDVMRATFRGTLAMADGLDELFTGFAVARAFASDDGTLSDPAPVFVDWDIPWPDKPRRLASSIGVAPLGAAYVRIRNVPKGARLRVEAEWEAHSKFRFTAVKVDAAGRRLAQIPITGLPRTTEAQRTIADLDGVATVLLVAMNAGDPSFGFDPDDVAWEPHSFLVTLAPE